MLTTKVYLFIFVVNATAEYVLTQVYPSLKAIDLVHTQ